jgi:hypothetical protein
MVVRSGTLAAVKVVNDPTAVLRLELETLWVTDSRGRLECSRTRDMRRAPLVAVAAGGDSVLWSCSSTVPDDVGAQIDEVLAAESPKDAHVGWHPDAAAVLLELLAELGPVGRVERGPSFVLTDLPDVPEGIECWSGSDADRQRLSGLMPEGDRQSLLEPWAVAVANGRVAAVCETARSAPAAVEAGVWTYEAYRRQGFGAAVTAAWTAIVADRTVFYSTSFDNLASQGIARRLGLRPIAQWWWVHASGITDQ